MKSGTQDEVAKAVHDTANRDIQTSGQLTTARVSKSLSQISYSIKGDAKGFQHREVQRHPSVILYNQRIAQRLLQIVT